MLPFCLLLSPAAMAQNTHTIAFSAGSEFFPGEDRNSNRGQFVKWNEMQSRLADERSRFQGRCIEAGDFCLPKPWARHIEKIRALPTQEKLDYANRLINQYRFINDRKLYKTRDYWATPLEMATHGQGDCEDFAIAKFALLLAAGVPENAMRVLILDNTRGNYRHAILTVATNQDIYYLDNEKGAVTRAGSVPYYRPIFSLNSNSWWLHQRHLASL